MGMVNWDNVGQASVGQDDEEEPLVCLDEHQGDCRGKVEYRMPLSPSGKPFARCDGHWEKRLEIQEGINRRYPDSPFPPADFDPTYAGERWDDDY